MIDINLGNVLTVGFISVLFYAGFQWLMSTLNISIPYITM